MDQPLLFGPSQRSPNSRSSQPARLGAEVTPLKVAQHAAYVGRAELRQLDWTDARHDIEPDRPSVDVLGPLADRPRQQLIEPEVEELRHREPISRRCEPHLEVSLDLP